MQRNLSSKCYPSYLEHFPCIKTLFDAAVKMEHFVMFTELLLLHIISVIYFQNVTENQINMHNFKCLGIHFLAKRIITIQV